MGTDAMRDYTVMGEMWLAVTDDGMFKCASRARDDTAVDEVPQEMLAYRAQGYIVKKVPYAEYVRVVKADYIARRAESMRAIAAQPPAVPLHVPVARIIAKGLRVRARCGECLEDEIEWQPAEEMLLVKSKKCNPNGEEGVELRLLDGGEDGWGYAGYESATKTWWRYRDEAKSGTYREHCMQILEIL